MFEKLVSFTKKVANLPDRPSLSPAELKATFDAAPDEVREYLNKLIDALKKTESGDSGAKNIGISTISGLTGTDIQTALENLVITSGSNANGSYTKFPDGTLICRGSRNATAGTGTQTTGVISFPLNFVGEAPQILIAHNAISGKFADYYVFGRSNANFEIYHIGRDAGDVSGTHFTYVATGRWK